MRFAWVRMQRLILLAILQSSFKMKSLILDEGELIHKTLQFFVKVVLRGMAVFFLETEIISRSSGGRVVRVAANRHGCRMRDGLYGHTHNGLNEASAVLHSEVSLPDAVPQWAVDRYGGGAIAASECLWNDIEEFEFRHRKRSVSQLASSYIMALPLELDLSQQLLLVHSFLAASFLKEGRIVDWVVRNKSGHNPCGFLLMPQRYLSDDWFGERVRTYIGRRQALLDLRASWADHVNLALENAGSKARVDHRKLVDVSDVLDL